MTSREPLGRVFLWLLPAAAVVAGLAISASERVSTPMASAEGEASDGLTVIVMTDGAEMSGRIVSETDKFVVLKTSFTEVRLPRSRIREIRRNVDPTARHREEWAERWKVAAALGKVSDYLSLGRWAREHGLAAEGDQAFEQVIRLEPENLEARAGLGHGKLDGSWVDRKRVGELLAQGYVLEGIELKKTQGNTAVSPGDEAEEESTVTDVRSREKARKAMERYRKQREAEFIGVPQDKAFKFTTEHFDIWCDSTEAVARTYIYIMEKLHEALSSRFTGGDVRGRDIRLGVYIYKTRAEFVEVTQMAGAGAFYRPDNECLYAFHGPFGETCTTFTTLAHEATHQFQGRKLGAQAMMRLPRTILEGMAVYFGDGSAPDPKKKKIVTGLVPRERLLHLKRKYEEGTYERLRDLIKVPVPNGSQYSDSWALINYFFAGPKSGGKVHPMMVDIWQMTQQRAVTIKEFEELANEHFGSIEALEKEIKDYTMTLEPHPTGEVKGDRWDSYEFKISIDRPSRDWEFRQDSEHADVLLTMRTADENGPRIEVRTCSKDDPFMQTDGFIESMTTANPYWAQDFVFEGKQDTEFVDRTVHELTFKDLTTSASKPPVAPPGPGAGPEPGAPKPTSGDPAPIDKKVVKKYREYWSMLPDRAYRVRCYAPETDFDKYDKIFRKTAESLSIRLENRW